MTNYDGVRELIKELAAKAFAQHEIELTSYGGNTKTFRCSARGRSDHWFGLMFGPGVIALWGDLPEFVLRHSDADSLGWALRLNECPGYMVGKIAAGTAREFYQADAKSYLEEQIKLPVEERDIASFLANNVHQELDSDDFNEYEWNRAWHECGADEAPDFLFPSGDALWLHEALLWFGREYRRLENGAE